jgi:hypothetical protein
MLIARDDAIEQRDVGANVMDLSCIATRTSGW